MTTALCVSPDSVHDWLVYWKDAVQTLSIIVGLLAAVAAAFTYYSNSQRERAQWVARLYEKFYEEGRYREMREVLDDGADSDKTRTLVLNESAEFTDYLNFFELVCFLAQTRQVKESDVTTLFEYYLKCLKKHPSVVQYIDKPESGFEQLKKFLPKIRV